MRQESHRVHWQQWSQEDPQSKRDLITRSAAIRLSDAARARDVTQLLRETMELSGEPCPRLQDALILVGTLFHHAPIRFDHEQAKDSEPFHVVRSLGPDENPLQVRDLMKDVLKEKDSMVSQKNTIAPKLQWFFVPSDATSEIPNSIELDGYCTSMEDDEHDDDEDDDDDAESEDDEMFRRNDCCYPWRKKKPPNDKMLRRQFRKARRYQQLALHQTMLENHRCLKGYLWKQSLGDPHVWRKVHCVLTEDYLWFVHRLKKKKKHHRVIPNHGRVSMTRALLVEPSPQNTFLYRMPFAFEVVSGNGTSHVFRASCRNEQARWIRCLADRIRQGQENKMLEHAELIVIDETVARYKRLANIVVSDSIQKRATIDDDEDVLAVVLWGMQVVDYRECCRHIQKRLPAKTPVVAISKQPKRANESSLLQNVAHNEEDDEETRIMVRKAWEMVASLLSKATQMMAARRSRSIETLCRHIDYVLTGRFRPLSEAASVAVENNESHTRDAPPADLFDNLLLELQTTVKD